MVGEDTACCLDAVGINCMGACRFLNGGIVDIMRSGVCFLGGADIVSLGIQVSFDGGVGLGWVAAKGHGV